MGAFDLVGKFAKGAKKAAPFFSKADVVLDELQRNKGTGQEFLTEIIKKGVKPTELKERGIEQALKDKPKMTKAEVQKVFEQKSPPKVQEKVLTGETPDYDEFLEKAAQDVYGRDYWELNRQQTSRLNDMYGDIETTQYDAYRTPGGENYREILLKLPSRGLTDSERWELDLYNRDLKKAGKFVPEKQARYEELKAKEGNPDYVSGHYKADPNLLAHIRVQDFKTPEGKKVLLVDEIQSDWHQAGRKKGYASPEIFGFKYDSQKNDWVRSSLDEATHFGSSSNADALYDSVDEAKRMIQGVPDAPFKKNWHELSMKRVLDYAAENGYDTVAITPGAEQAKRYDLSKHIDSIAYNPETKLLDAWDQNRRQVMRREITDESQLEEYIGKEAAQKLLQAEPVMGKHLLEGQELQVGGEGMKGFYDKILPDYLNNYGKKYGASVEMRGIPLSKMVNVDDFLSPTETAEIADFNSKAFHTFNITPQMREEIMTKGQPLYGKVAMPALEGLAAGTGAATMAPEVFNANNEQQVQNPVHFTENPDAMLLELMQRN